jgi:guanine nucleotide-binding protein subunit alpha
MGACCSSNNVSGSASRLVEAQLRVDNEKYKKEVKLLLLGSLRYYKYII